MDDQEHRDEVREEVEGGDLPESVDTPPATEGMLAQVRELILKAHPDVVPEMVAGDTFESLIASVEPARSAYQRVIEGVQPISPSVPVVPAGQPGRQSTVNIEGLSASAKIAEGLRRRSSGS